MNRKAILNCIVESDTDDWQRIFEVWWSSTLRPLEEEAIALIREKYTFTVHWQARAAQLHYVTGFARRSWEAYSLAVTALNDPSIEVRYRAYVLLAYSQRKRAMTRLSAIAKREDDGGYAAAAIEAIDKKSMKPITKLDRKNRIAYFLPIKLPARMWFSDFAEQFHCLAGKWLKKLGFVPQSIFQHDAFYRRGTLWFHAYWEQWDVQWLFMLGRRERLSESYIGVKLPQPYSKSESGTLENVCALLQKEIADIIHGGR